MIKIWTEISCRVPGIRKQEIEDERVRSPFNIAPVMFTIN
jgi:hypothetical protein